MRCHTKKDTHKISIWEVTPKQRDTHLHSLAFSKFNSFMKLNFFTSSSCEKLIFFTKFNYLYIFFFCEFLSHLLIADRQPRGKTRKFIKKNRLKVQKTQNTMEKLCWIWRDKRMKWGNKKKQRALELWERCNQWYVPYFVFFFFVFVFVFVFIFVFLQRMPRRTP